LQQSLTLELKNKVTSINSLASGIASVNEKIARAVGNGQPPNDLLDQRDQLVRELNQFIQTTSIPATDGTVGIFIGGSQALVLGNTAAKLELGADDFGVQNNKLSLSRNGQTVPLNEATLGGGEVPGLLRFQNTDMAEARNLLGRYAVAITTSMNAQHALGLDLNGNVGGNLSQWISATVCWSQKRQPL
jgi:flagellar hook-associated protein 1 FlgK